MNLDYLNNKDIKLLYIDLFCGAGGTSTGVETARHNGKKCAKVIGCVNHDKNAIASHAENHPNALHFTEDIRTLELSPLIAHIKKMRELYPDAFIVLWASLECTNFSKAKGGQPRDADSRTLAEHLFRYIEAISPDYIQIENVEEFMCWGDLDENGKPVSKDKGRKYLQWVERVKHCGYNPNHNDYNFKYRILNAADYGAYTSRKRFFGIFAKNGLPIVFPSPTHAKTINSTEQTSLFEQKRLKKWKPVKDVLDFSDEGRSIFTRKKPLSDKTLERIYAGLIKFVAGGKDNFLSAYYGVTKNFNRTYEQTAKTVEEPCGVLTTESRFAKVQCAFISKQYSGHPESKNISVEGPAHTVTPIDHHVLINTSFLMNPQYSNTGGSIKNPCFTIIARMDKKPPYLISTETGGIAVKVYKTDSEPMRKIKEFMALHGIIDIKMRMLKVPELKQIMGFPKNYVLIGTQAEQKKFIGNAVEVRTAKALCEALCNILFENKIYNIDNQKYKKIN
jgi:DNA (cytosine-5)-methyltransferase 1